MDQINETLFSFEQCTPMTVVTVYSVMVVLSLFYVKKNLRNTYGSEVDHVFQLLSMAEFKFLILLAMVVYGLCKNNQDMLSWAVLFIPLVFIMVKGVYIFTGVNTLYNEGSLDDLKPPPVVEQIVEQKAPDLQQLQQIQLQNLSSMNNIPTQPPVQNLMNPPPPPVNKTINGLNGGGSFGGSTSIDSLNGFNDNGGLEGYSF